MTNKTIALFESIIGKKPDAFLHEPVYQVTESELLEFARQLAALEAPSQELNESLYRKALQKIMLACAEGRSLGHISRIAEQALDSSAPLSPDHSGGAGTVAISAAEAFGKGFNLLEQTDGKYSITMAFQNSDDAFDAYRQLAELRKCLDKVKELNQ